MNKFAAFYLGEMEKKALSPETWTNLARVIGGTAGGALAHSNAEHTGLSGTPLWTSTAIGVLSGGAAGGGITKAKLSGDSLGHAIGAAKVPVMTSLANDMYGAPIYGNLSGNIRAQNDAHAQALVPKTAPEPQQVNLNPPSISNGTKLLAGAAGLGLSAAGIYALTQIARANKRKAEGGAVDASGAAAPANAEPSSLGTLRVTLPTKNDKDHETQVEMPLERIGLSHAILSKIRRDTKRRLRGEGNERTHKLLLNPSIQ